MQRPYRLLWRSLTILIGAALCLPLAGSALAAPKAATIKPAPLRYKLTRLSNGLKVITLEDHHAPVVTLQIWYHVGSKDEAPGKAGFAHLFEHLMFKGSEHVGPQEHAKYIEQIGGVYNANTSYDRTLFFETVPSNALDRILYLEADRMASLRVDEANLKSERDVVEEEYRLRVANAPYGMLQQEVGEMLFPKGHPYAHTPIGIMADLDSAQLSDVRAFHDMYYRPDNATLVLVGDFTTAEGLEKIKRYFGPIPHSTQPFTRYPAIPSHQTAPKHAVFYDKLAQLPLIGIGYRLPVPKSKDTPVFDVIAYILSTGESSRLNRALVRDQQIAVEADGEAETLLLGGYFFCFALADRGKDPAVLEKALKEQVALLQNTPVSPEELAKARNQALTAHVFGTLSTTEKAGALGEADLLYDTPEEANKELSDLAAVTAADIQRVAQKYFAQDQSNIFYVLPIAMQPKSETTPKESK